MTTRWRLFRNNSRSLSTAEGLAIDDTLPQSVADHSATPILHLYTFVPSVIVGKYQDIEAALRLDRCKARGIEFNRRSTGGGTVIMGPEIVALGLGINVDWPGLRNSGVGGVFQSMGEVLSKALEGIGISSQFRAKNDLEVSGKKIAGLSAASETGKSLLFHTSFLVDFDVELMTDIMNTPLVKLSDKGYNCFSRRMTTLREELGRDISVMTAMDMIQRAFEEQFGVSFEEDGPDEWEKNMVDRFVRERYTNPEWIFSHKHPRSRMGVGRLKTTGGLLEIYLSLSGGAIESVVITGDFFSTSEDISRLENVLKWTSAREEKIRESLEKVWRKDMIYGLDVDTLTSAVLLAKENQVRL
jgi:lipoate-protein ligase A